MQRCRSFLAIGAVVVLAIATACSEEEENGPTSSGSTPTQSPTLEESPAQSPSDETVTYEVWFATDEGLFVTHRTEPAATEVGAASVLGLIQGPTSEEEAADVATAVPAATELLGLDIDDGVATVDLSKNFESGGGSLSAQMRLAQLVYTLTQFPTVDAVRLHLDGKPVDVFSSEGIVIDRPLNRRGFKDFLAPIVVTAPAIGATVSSPVTVEGTANVFEATVSLRILDSKGKEIARDFTTATCGTGCRGDYSTKLRFNVSVEQEGTIEVFEDSAEDGSAIHVVRIPVTLVP